MQEKKKENINKKSSKNNKKKSKRIRKIITILLYVFILIFFGIIFYLNIIDLVYTIGGLIITLLFSFFITKCNLSRKRGIRIIGYFFSIIIILLIAFVLRYLFNTAGFLFNATNGNFNLKNYNVVVLNDSNYTEIKDIAEKNLGLNEASIGDNLNKLKELINKKVKINYENYEDSTSLIKALDEQDVAAIILEDSELSLIEEEDPLEYDKLKTIYEVKIKNDVKNLLEAVNINQEPFNVYISGIDTYGSINSVSRSDVNILMTVNPKNEKILITWIPRDYYVKINNSSYKDKLTHAGMYGIDSSIYAIENLLNTDINYYVKVNFTSVIEVVDALDGITVENDETFTTNENITFRKGTVNLDGERALSFVRDRKHVTGGDLGRGKNQIKVLEAIMNKAKSPAIIKSYNRLLNSLDDAFVTNMSQNAMIGFIKRELQSPRNWQIESITLDGSNGYEYTYTYKNKQLYVMIPDEEMINSTKIKIKNLLEN